MTCTAGTDAGRTLAPAAGYPGGVPAAPGAAGAERVASALEASRVPATRHSCTEARTRCAARCVGRGPDAPPAPQGVAAYPADRHEASRSGTEPVSGSGGGHRRAS